MNVPHGQKGFTLLEALITVVVISLGLLGMLGLQAVGLASTQVSGARSIAALEVDNMTNRMRANALALRPSALPIEQEDYAFRDIVNPSSGDAPGTNCASSECTPVQLAIYDSYQWDLALGNLLPQGRGQIECLDAPCRDDSAYRITVIWNEKDRVEGADETQTYSAVLRP